MQISTSVSGISQVSTSCAEQASAYQLRSCWRRTPREIHWITLGLAIQVHLNPYCIYFVTGRTGTLCGAASVYIPLYIRVRRPGSRSCRSFEVLVFPSTRTRLHQVWHLAPRLHHKVPGPQVLLALAALCAPLSLRSEVTVEINWSTPRARKVEPVPRYSMDLSRLPPPS